MTYKPILIAITLTAVLASTTCTAENPDYPPYADLDLSERYAIEGSNSFELNCPIENVIRTDRKLNSSKIQERMKKELVKDVQLTWLKDKQPIHRISGNYMTQNKQSLFLMTVSSSDQGRYTCKLNYSKVNRTIMQLFVPIASLSFNLNVDNRNFIAPDIEPHVTDPPINMLASRGSNATFTCKSIATLSHRTTYWFKSCTPLNSTCGKEFLKAFDSAKLVRTKGPVSRFLIDNLNSDELDVFNVSEKDIGYYGCLVENQYGIDIRLGRLQLIDTHLKMRGPGDSFEFDDNETFSLVNQVPRLKIDASSQSVEHAFSYKEAIAIVTIPVLIVVIVLATMIILLLKNSKQNDKKQDQSNLIVPAPIIGNMCHEVGLRQHLPNGDCPDIYNIGKNSDGFISGHLLQDGGHLMAQSICSQMLDKEKNPSISSNSNSDEASSLGKSMSSQGDNSRAFYLHTSNTTTTTVPMYDHPPSTGTSHLRDAIAHDACVINPIYGFLRPDSDTINWAFPRRNLEKLNKIGEGQFGEVWRYVARQKDGNGNIVAVKKLKNRVGLGQRERLELIAEIEIMKLVNNHPNVIKLLNYCADEFEPILLIMEYAENGKLQTYLRDCRSIRRPYGFPCDPNSVITSKELIKFSYHIAKGMEYVAEQGIIHRDLASRNILVSEDKVCKVGDFGFARRVTDECAYERTTANPVPVKWMAPEALVENKFTSKSDVFSLGILMWEIVTLGATPYEYLTSQEVFKKVTMGGRLERPAHCKDEFYNIMAKCWLHDPTERPTFKELAAELEKLLLSENDYIELDQYPEHAYYNILNIPEKDIVNITPCP